MTESFSTNAGVAAWIRKQVTALTDTESYAPGPNGDADLIEDFELTIREYALSKERAARARIQERFVEREQVTARRTTSESDVSLPWLHGS